MSPTQTTLLSIVLVCAGGCLSHTRCGGVDEPVCDASLDSGRGDAGEILDGQVGDGHTTGRDRGVAEGGLSDGGGPEGGIPDDGGPGGGPDGGPDIGSRIERVDLLFVIDNSGSTTEEQAALKNEIPTLVLGLAAGIAPDGERFSPVEDIHMGVVTTDMGTGGFTIPTCNEPTFGDDGIFRHTGPRCDFLPEDLAFLTLSPGADPGWFASSVQCLTNVGTSGCGFEQQLDAMLKSIAPASDPAFAFDTGGHGDGANAGFLRDDSLLVIILLSDEDDCSAADPDLFNRTSSRYPQEDLNLRCFNYPEALHPISRYVDGLLALHPPDRLIFNLVAGIPADLEAAPGERMDYTRLIGPDRDPRMVERPSLDLPGLVPSCDNEQGRAYPPSRMVALARDLEIRGAHSHVESICKDRFNTAATVLSLIAQRR